MRVDRSIAIALGLASLLQARVVRAQDDDARARAATLFKQAAADYAGGHTEQAALEFEASHALVPRAAAVYSAARAWDANGALDRAADDYESALERTDLHGVDAQDARRRLDEIAPRVAVVTIAAPKDAHVWMGHVEDHLGELRVRLLPGEYDARVERSGDEPWHQHVRVGAGQTLRLEPALAATIVRAPPESPPPRVARNRTPAWVSLGLAAAAAIVSVVLYAETLHARDTFEASGDVDPHLRNVATTWRTSAYVGYGVTGAAAATGLVLLAW